ncbi:ser/thr protein phosphatase superfamily [Anaeramoeba flamelloides]|uniref:Ser/thr protein phosphatase superfamily n=1 Tax=Anaeramoeba flamelloides TaxID=1746091 RepID=A0ABQ8ZDL7_9EUKA|nr:ser/thr protein phosphatase superfamily [Anaeramoeba flamelloides]
MTEQISDFVIEMRERENFTLQIASDLHIEMFYVEKLPSEFSSFVKPNADFLALLGDIGDPDEESYFNFLTEMSENFQEVFVVSGNHEYYRQKRNNKKKKNFDSTNEAIDKICSKIEKGNVKFLNNISVQVILKNRVVRILGCTLWSHIPENNREIIKLRLTDYRVIYQDDEEKITTKFTQKLHLESVDWIKKNLLLSKTLKEEQVIVLSHHCPTLQKVAKEDDLLKPIVNAFASDLESFFAIKNSFFMKKKNTNLKLWACGHTHHCFDFVLKGTRILSNPKGYLYEKMDYRLDFAVEI